LHGASGPPLRLRVAALSCTALVGRVSTEKRPGRKQWRGRRDQEEAVEREKRRMTRAESVCEGSRLNQRAKATPSERRPALRRGAERCHLACAWCDAVLPLAAQGHAPSSPHTPPSSDPSTTAAPAVPRLLPRAQVLKCSRASVGDRGTPFAHTHLGDSVRPSIRPPCSLRHLPEASALCKTCAHTGGGVGRCGHAGRPVAGRPEGDPGLLPLALWARQQL
jgi:hypothetical protein